MVLGFLRGIFKGGGQARPEMDVEPVEHEGFTVRPTPMRDGSSWRVCGEISMEVDGALRTHRFLRADTFPERQAAIDTTILKARRIIEERGAKLFDE
jgi:hypothetical protein